MPRRNRRLSKICPSFIAPCIRFLDPRRDQRCANLAHIVPVLELFDPLASNKACLHIGRELVDHVLCYELTPRISPSPRHSHLPTHVVIGLAIFPLLRKLKREGFA